MKLNERYRLKRVDPNNVAIQKVTNNGNWITKSYHGNSLKSLARGLENVIVSNMALEDAKLYEQLKKLRLEIVSRGNEIEKMIKEAGL